MISGKPYARLLVLTDIQFLVNYFLRMNIIVQTAASCALYTVYKKGGAQCHISRLTRATNFESSESLRSKYWPHMQTVYL